jgi:3,5-epimerase/4-reductase
MDTIIIFGARGYLGQYFQAQYPHAHTPEVDIGDKIAVGKVLDELKPDVVINAAGRTGRPNVDWCETHKQETHYGNVTAPLVLMDECVKRDIYMVQISTGCMFEGDNGGKGFSECDDPNFFGSFYSRGKAWLDAMCREYPVFLPRLRMPIDGTTHERNLITKISKYENLLDAKKSMTYLPDLMMVIDKMIEQRFTGPLNIANPGMISPYDIMVMYQKIVDPAHTFGRFDAAALDKETAARRSNCMLNTDKLVELGIVLPPIEDRVRKALEMIKEANE